MFGCPVATGYTKPRCLPTITRTLGNRPAKSARRGFGCPKKTRTTGQPSSKQSARITIIGYLWPDGSCVCSFPDSMPAREPFFQTGSGTKIHKPSGPNLYEMPARFCLKTQDSCKGGWGKAQRCPSHPKSLFRQSLAKIGPPKAIGLYINDDTATAARSAAAKIRTCLSARGGGEQGRVRMERPPVAMPSALVRNTFSVSRLSALLNPSRIICGFLQFTQTVNGDRWKG